MALTIERARSKDANRAWREAAACRDLDPNVFFPVGVTGPAVEHVAVAKGICAGCPVDDECLAFAITTNQEFGIWGGTTQEERRVLRRQWRARVRPQRRAAS